MSKSQKRSSLAHKLQDAKERIENGENSGSMEFVSQRALAIFLGGDTRVVQRNGEKLKMEGFVFPEAKESISFDERIKKAKECIKNGENNRSMEFDSLSALVAFSGVDYRAAKQYVEKLRKEGFVFPEVNKLTSIDDRIKKAKERIKNGENNRSMEFDSLSALAIFLGSLSTAAGNEKKLRAEGFIFPEVKESISIDNRIKDAKECIGNGENNGSMKFDSCSALMNLLGINSLRMHQNKKKLRAEGFVFPEAKKNPSIDDRIKDAKERIKNGENKGSMEFSSQQVLLDLLGVDTRNHGEAPEKLREEGFIFPEVKELISTDERIRHAKERIRNGENNGSMEFSSQQALADFLRSASKAVKQNKKKLREEGFVFPDAQAPVSKNITMAIDECKDQGVFLESGELLPDISKEFFSRHIRPFKGKDDHSLLTIDIVKNFSQEEKDTFVKECVMRLMSEDRGDYSMLELKLELFSGGIYLSEESIIEALIRLGESVDREDSIQKRLRLCAAFVSHGLVEAEYVDKLPTINNSIGGNLILDRRIKNKKTLLKLWREYALYSIKNDITGHVSRAKIQDAWDGKLDSLFALNQSYEKAYLLDSESIWFLEEVGYEGVLAMCQFGSKQSKNSLTKMYHSIHARCIGFFLYLNRKKYALLQPKHIIFTGAHSVTDTARAIMDDHVVMRGLEDVLNMDNVPQLELRKIKQKNVDLLAMKFAGCVLEGCDLSTLSSKDLYVFLDHSSHEAVSGTIVLETLVLTLLRSLGNRAAIKKKKEFSFDNEVLQFKHDTKLNENTLKNYKKLLSQMIDVVRKRHRDGDSNGYIKQQLSQVFVLMRFLDTFSNKLNRKEMATVLNTIIVSGVDNSFTVWGQKNLSAAQYADFTRKMPILFDHIADEEYRGLYSHSWRVKNKTKTRTLIREGMNAEAYKILQHVAIYDPPRADEYPFVKTTPQGEQLDLSWWPYDFSPIPVICNWLIVKTTRRKGNVRQLDVNSFLRVDEDEQITHMHFNTDKNRDSKESDIAISLLRYLFTTEELELLKKYVEYIKNAYSAMTPVSYESVGGHYEKIMPLFPHHKDNAVIADVWVDGYHYKTMLKTEMIVKIEALRGTFDHFIEEQDRDRRKNDLANIKLVTKKPSGKKKIPKSLEELDDVPLPTYTRSFSVEGGVHNMRHAGISALGAQLPLVYVRLIAGHSDINTTARVYFHVNDDIVEHEIKASLNEPVGAGSQFIRKNIMPFIESENPKEVEQILIDNHFMTVSREILHNGEIKMIEDGLAQGTKLHPSLWVPEKHGVCVNNKQCPAGTNGCCALCPFNVFSPMHIKGVIYELNTCLENITLISQKVTLDARHGINISREEMKDAHQQKIVEMAAWFDVLDRINEKMNELGYSPAKNLPVFSSERPSKGLYSMGTCTIEESMMELLVDAKSLLINDLDTDNRVAKLSHKLMQAAIHRKDYDALSRMANEGINHVVDAYGKKAAEDRRGFLLEQLKAGSLSGNIVSLDEGNSPAELLPVR